MKTRLDTFNNSWYKPGNPLKRILWYCTSYVFLESAFPINSIKKLVLRMFGATIGKGVVIKPNVQIKYPWKLKVGDYSWIGEHVWIDNLAEVTIGSHCCISQGALLLTGNHDYRKSTFDLVIGEIKLEDGSWVGAKSTVCPGVTLHDHAVLAVGSVATKNLDSSSIYQGNPAVKIRDRVIKE
ncbi:MAG: WcaF family extracellular polysaccharide biosynthesis acetyltransferase [Flavobacteriales bacterium]